MARNKYPQQTIRKILDVSLHLFLEKGYEKTTIQDIVNELGMSKGAIYHHFKSKEEILNALGDQFYNDHDYFRTIQKRKDINGLEKIREIFRMQIHDDSKTEMDTLILNVWKDPKFFMLCMQENITINAKQIEPLLLEGMEDGSIKRQDEKCAAQVLMMLLNIWVFSPLSGFAVDELNEKIEYLRYICEAMGIPVINDELETACKQYFTRIAKSI